MADSTLESLFSLKSVVELTGIGEHTIRAWEARYDAVTPERSPSGRRLYASADVARLRLLARLVERGHSIGHIARATDAVLQRMLAEAERSERADEASQSPGPAVPEALTKKIKLALRHFDLSVVQDALKEARILYGARTFALGVVAIVMAEIGELVESRDLTIAHEHALSAIVKAQLMDLLFTARPSQSAKRVALATPEGDLHEIGLLISGVLCVHHGFDVIYIGPNMPPDALGEALRALKTQFLILGTVQLPPSMEKWDLEVYVTRLANFVDSKHEIWIGGVPRRELALSAVVQPWRHLRALSALDRALEDFA